MNFGIKSFGSYIRTKLSLRDPDHWQSRSSGSRSGVSVTASNVVGLSTAWGCITLLAGTTGSLSVGVYQKIDDVLIPAADHPLHKIIAADPNYDLAADEFWEYIQASIEIRGNGYAEKKRGVSGNVIALDPINPALVQTKRLKSGEIEYRWTDPDGGPRVLTDKDILHIRGPMGNALGGKSPISACSEVFGGAIAADHAAARSFKNGISTVGAVKMEKALNGDQRKKLRENLRDDYAGAENSGTPMILDNGLDWASIKLSPEDLQMLESRKFSVEEICRIFGVPPHLVQHMAGNTALGSSITEQTLGFLKFTLRRRLKRIERAIEKQLLSPEDRAKGFRVKFDLRELLRADDKGRAEYYEKMTRMGVYAIDYVRELENLPPLPDGLGAMPRVQMQNVTLSVSNEPKGDS